MSHAKNKVDWCLKKAEQELKTGAKHRGLVKTKPSKERAKEHIKKAEHYLRATEVLKREGFSDISASTAFYSMYHCMLSIAAKFGYESGNQECTFALIHSLREEGKIDFEKELLEKISSLQANEISRKTITSVREQFQYGTSLSIKDDLYGEILELTKNVLARTKVIAES